jgi:hypothetical protein
MTKPVSILVTGFGVSATPLRRRLHRDRVFAAREQRDTGGMSGTRGCRDGQLLRTSRAAASSVGRQTMTGKHDCYH